MTNPCFRLTAAPTGLIYGTNCRFLLYYLLQRPTLRHSPAITVLPPFLHGEMHDRGVYKTVGVFRCVSVSLSLALGPPAKRR
ncbi:unnamed protein product [Schistocephalus solidus]|uniref:Secreted protein n=1 Tax=Schistocephalus solidus TaxID=70667 RepID=A0A183SS99_SCHSO|nr:unnamed protein product [Schistocephalus solidus]